MTIVAHEKHGTFLYETALGLLQQRVKEGWYYGDDQAKAEAVLAEGSEDKAWKFLKARSAHEYENVEMQKVRS
jgi:hypothetical protein